MSKSILVHDRYEIDELLAKIECTARAALQTLAEIAGSGAGMESLAKLKFKKIGFDPIDLKRSLNLIEQINQSFTYVASLRATCRLQELHPDAQMFTLNLGTASGTDVESADCGGIAAEVFSAVKPHNNQKLKKEVCKVSRVDARYKYVFFLSPGYASSRRPTDPEYPDVIIEAVDPYSGTA